MLCDTEDLFDNMDDLEGEDASTVEDFLDVDVDGLASDDEVPTEQFSRLAGERMVEPRPVLETANRLKTDFRQEVQAPKVASSMAPREAKVKDGPLQS